MADDKKIVAIGDYSVQVYDDLMPHLFSLGDVCISPETLVLRRVNTINRKWEIVREYDDDTGLDARLTVDDIVMAHLASIKLYDFSRGIFRRCTINVDAPVERRLCNLRDKGCVFDVGWYDSNALTVFATLNLRSAHVVYTFSDGTTFRRRSRSLSSQTVNARLSLLDIDPYPIRDVELALIDAASGVKRPWYDRLFPELKLKENLDLIKEAFLSGRLFER